MSYHGQRDLSYQYYNAAYSAQTLPWTYLKHLADEFLNSKNGAGEGNRTLITSLEGWGFTTKLHPHKLYGGGRRIRTYVDIRRQIYSLLPLTARPSLQHILIV